MAEVLILAIDEGEVASDAGAGTANLQCTQRNWPINVFGNGNHAVSVLGQVRLIQSNTADTLTVTTNWTAPITAGQRYIIFAMRMMVDLTPGLKAVSTVLDEATIAAGATTLLGDCAAIDLSHGPVTLSITVEATYNVAAGVGIRLHVRSSYDAINYDTQDWDTWNPGFVAGASIRQTEEYDVGPYALKVLVENLDPGQPVTDVKIIATVGA